MKVSQGFLLRKIAGKNIVISVNDSLNFNGMITLNETGVFLWDLLQKNTTKEELLKALLAEYDVSEAEASEDIDNFLNKLYSANILED